MREFFLLRPDMTFLNHGSFGACSRPVFEVYQKWQLELERQPLEFLGRRAAELLQTARTGLANYLKTPPNDVVFIPNTTTGVNIVARSLKFELGDEILATDHEYGAVDRAWKFLCQKSGAVYKKQSISLPVTTPEDFVEQFWQGVTPRTKLISISHITSATALIFPIEEICRRARQAGILTLIDGAHAPGQIPLDLTELAADFYTGNCHKWLCAPKGSAFLYARPEVQNLLEPLIVSWGWDRPPFWPGTSDFIDWLEWQGTRDLAAYLSVPAAIEFQAQHNWPQVRQACRELVTYAITEISQLSQSSLPYPLGGDRRWYEQMAIAPFPIEPEQVPYFSKKLWDEYKVEVQTTGWGSQTFIRVSVQAYNTRQDIDRLLEVLKQVMSISGHKR